MSASLTEEVDCAKRRVAPINPKCYQVSENTSVANPLCCMIKYTRYDVVLGNGTCFDNFFCKHIICSKRLITIQRQNALLLSSSMILIVVDANVVVVKPESIDVSFTVNDSVVSTMSSLLIGTIPYRVSPLASPALKITDDPATFEKSSGDFAVSWSVENLEQKDIGPITPIFFNNDRASKVSKTFIIRH